MAVSLTVEQTLTILSETPDRIAELTADASPTRLTTVPEPGEWSAVEVLAHVRWCADGWGAAIDAILAEEHATISAFDAHPRIDPPDYRDLEFGRSLRAFTRQRTKLLTILEELRPRDWERAATVTGSKRPLEEDVRSIARELARHERPHIRQIRKLVDG